MTEIGLLGAFLGGLLTLVSPCAALLLPSFFAYAFGGTGRLAARSATFLLGMLLVLVPLGAGVGAAASLLNEHRDLLTTVAAWVLIALGVLIMAGFGFGSARAGAAAARVDASSWVSILLLGTVYGLAGFCSGPLLGAVLTVAVAGGSAAYGGLLMAVYALGMTVPLFVLAVLWDRFDLGRRSWLRPRPVRIGPLQTSTTSVISGVLFIAIGILFLVTAGTASIGSPIGVDTQVQWQASLRELTDRVGNLWTLFVLAVLVMAYFAIRVFRGRHRIDRQPDVRADTRTRDGASGSREPD